MDGRVNGRQDEGTEELRCTSPFSVCCPLCLSLSLALSLSPFSLRPLCEWCVSRETVWALFTVDTDTQGNPTLFHSIAIFKKPNLKGNPQKYFTGLGSNWESLNLHICLFFSVMLCYFWNMYTVVWINQKDRRDIDRRISLFWGKTHLLTESSRICFLRQFSCCARSLSALWCFTANYAPRRKLKSVHVFHWQHSSVAVLEPNPSYGDLGSCLAWLLCPTHHFTCMQLSSEHCLGSQLYDPNMDVIPATSVRFF